jgi:hypothetical protein
MEEAIGGIGVRGRARGTSDVAGFAWISSEVSVSPRRLLAFFTKPGGAVRGERTRRGQAAMHI